MDLGLAGRVALIVGGSGRIGLETGRQLLAEGATVVLAARTAEKVDAAVTELGGAGPTLSGLTVDTGDDASVEALVAAVLAAHGRLDVVVNTAAPPANLLDPAKDRDP